MIRFLEIVGLTTPQAAALYSNIKIMRFRHSAEYFDETSSIMLSKCVVIMHMCVVIMHMCVFSQHKRLSPVLSISCSFCLFCLQLFVQPEKLCRRSSSQNLTFIRSDVSTKRSCTSDIQEYALKTWYAEFSLFLLFWASNALSSH